MGRVQPGDIQIDVVTWYILISASYKMSIALTSSGWFISWIRGEKHPPEVVQRGFETMVVSIQDTVAAIKPGMLGKEIDAIARKIITDAGYAEFMHATSHPPGTPGS